MQSRVTVVTGAASGMGLATAQAFARSGYKVAMLDLQQEAVERASRALNDEGYETLHFAVDVSNRAQIEDAITQIRATFGPIECAVLCAGISEYVPFLEMSFDTWQRVLNINLNSMFHCIQLVIPDMVEAGWGRIVTISSMSAQVGGPRMAHYSASKGGVTSLTKAIAREFAEQGITANTIPPSIVQTGMTVESEKRGTNPGAATMAAMVPVKRVGQPEDIASACLWLCSDQAGFVTGQEINVNGGMYS